MVFLAPTDTGEDGPVESRKGMGWPLQEPADPVSLQAA